MKQTLRIILASALITAAAIKGAPALAEAGPAEPAIEVSVVHTADLDLSTSVGRRQLETRIARAAREVCGAASDIDLKGKNQVRKCRDDVLANAGAQSDNLQSAARRGDAIAITAAR